jgi:hypothetical protein
MTCGFEVRLRRDALYRANLPLILLRCIAMEIMDALHLHAAHVLLADRCSITSNADQQ